MKGPNTTPPRQTTLGELSPSDTGIGTGSHEGMVLLFRAIGGDMEWVESLHPEEAEYIGKMLLEEAIKARKQRAS